MIGVDASPDMAALARESPPDADLHEAGLHRLPLSAGSLGTVVRAPALTHVPALAPAPAEFAPRRTEQPERITRDGP